MTLPIKYVRSGLVGRVEEWDSDSGTRMEQSTLDVLMALLHMGYALGQMSEFGGSVPELCVTLPEAAYSKLEEAAKHSQFKACVTETHPVSGLPYLKYDYGQAASFGPSFVLIIQQGTESGKTEVKN